MINRRNLEKIKIEFERDIKDHVIKIKLDDGLYRHMCFKQANTNNQWFEIITSPMLLTINGDMGTYIFSRTEDMFTFFRGDTIDPNYWGEKLQAFSSEGFESFNGELFRERVKEYMEDWEFDDEEQKGKVESDVEDKVLSVLDQYSDNSAMFPAYIAVSEYESEWGHKFEDFQEVSCSDFSYHYLWCCHALQWSVKEYDKLKK